MELLPSELLHVVAHGSDTETVTVALQGELDISSTDWFGAFVDTVLEKHPTAIAIDTRRVTFMDSSGLRSLLLARASAHDAGATFRVDSPPPELRRLIERTGLQGVLLDE